MSKGSQQQ